MQTGGGHLSEDLEEGGGTVWGTLVNLTTGPSDTLTEQWVYFPRLASTGAVAGQKHVRPHV